MITKTANTALNLLTGVGGPLLAARNALHQNDKLTKEEIDALVDHYDVAHGSALRNRTFGRAALGYLLGNAPGAAVGGYLTKSPGGRMVGGMAGGLIGANLMAKKYSPDEARRILLKNRNKE